MANKKDRYFYPAVFGHDEGRTDYYVLFPDFDVATQGKDMEDALLMARECLGLNIWSCEDDGEELPAPTPVDKVELQEGEQVMLVDVFMPSIRNSANNKSVSRTVTLPAWLNSVALEHNVNFSRVLQDALKKLLNV